MGPKGMPEAKKPVRYEVIISNWSGTGPRLTKELSTPPDGKGGSHENHGKLTLITSSFSREWI
jgi:hypothetical protein